MRRNFALSVLVLGAGACVVHANDDGCSNNEDYVCHLEYTPGYGYERVCEWTIDPLICVDLNDDSEDGRPTRYHRSSSDGTSSAGSAGVAGSSGTSESPPRATAPDVGTDVPCTRDGQCGTGLCIEGECFYGCSEDTDCGTGDVCALVSATPVCQAPAAPAVQCTRSADCGNGQLCLNAICHDSCVATED